ncbi:MAG TPA: helix-turn-helix domain-containing protein [Beijerinckiaceae bacterium]|nr:helix-turn-helix domain-containing protein [Beijerinckiaceae bacterium]
MNVVTNPEEVLPPDGQLLAELGYVDEAEAAAGLGITTKTLIDYRRNGKGPLHTEVARRILYSRQAIANWLATGGARATDPE